MALKGKTREEKIWNYLYKDFKNKFGVAGLMGNLKAESNLNPKNLQNTFEKKLGMTDAEYTKAVNKGTYKNFVNDKAGYGLAQWTFYTRKQKLLDYTKDRNGKIFIGHLATQLEFLLKELKESYPTVYKTLKNAKSVKEASNAVLLNFEKPADQSASVQNTRTKYSQEFYNKFAAEADTPVTQPSTISIQIHQAILTKNPCYTSGRKIAVKGLMLHSIGCPQPNAQVFINSWNSPSYGSACVHGFIDGNTGAIYQTLPWDHRGWHCGGSGNNTHIGVEMCEPASIRYTSGANFTCSNLADAKASAKRTYESAVKLFAYLCKRYNLNPLADGVIVSHKEGCSRGIATNHGDPEHLWTQLGMGYTMNGFRKDVNAALGGVTSSSSNVSKPTTPPAGSYKVKITADVLNIRSGPGTNYKVVGAIKDKGTYTIVSEQNGFGKLASGAGYISLSYAKRV
ncbi:MAG: PGRP protein [Caudoviricetes sp.]|nr:MAG: PGRP protein [Caudoviricetes sp.]